MEEEEEGEAAGLLTTALSVPPGFRFHPTDEELLNYYLRRKVAYQHSDVITDIDLNKVEPWDLKERCRIGSGPQNEWYFFSHKDKKYPTGTRTNRATVVGFWKATGRDKPIYLSGGSNFVDGGHKRIGMRKTLVFYMGRAPTGQKSHWIMHEYRLYHDDRHSKSDQIIQGDGWVVCRVFKKKNYHHSIHSHQHQYQRGEELHRGALMATDGNNNPIWEFGHHNSIIQQLLINPDPMEPGLTGGGGGGGGGDLNFNIGDWSMLDKLVSSSHQNLDQLINHHGRIGVHGGGAYYNNYMQQPQSTTVMMNTYTGAPAASGGGGGGGGGGGLMLQYHLGFQNN